jgi:hypothetical protein
VNLQNLDLIIRKSISFYDNKTWNFRTPQLFRKLDPKYNYVDSNPDDIFTKFPEEVALERIVHDEAIYHHQLVLDEEMLPYAPNSLIIPRALNISSFPFVGMSNHEDPLIVHTPTRRVLKGTSYILNTIEQLQKEGLKFRFKLAENMSHEEVLKLYQEADIIIDGYYYFLFLFI